jgi:hypothetical protein
MRLLISALAAAGIIGFSMVGFAADPGEPYTAKPKIDKPGRAIDDGTVQSGTNLKKPGRQIDDGTVTTAKPKKFGREIDDGTVQAGKPKKYGREIDDGTLKTAKPKKYGREIDDGTLKTAKPKKYGREIDDQKKAVKAKGPTDQPGRAVDDSKK